MDRPEEGPVHGEWTVVVIGQPEVAAALRDANLVSVDDTPTSVEDAVNRLGAGDSHQLAVLVADDGRDTLVRAVNFARDLGVNTVVIASGGQPARLPPPPRVVTPVNLNDILVTLSTLDGWPRLMSADGWDTLVYDPAGVPPPSVAPQPPLPPYSPPGAQTAQPALPAQPQAPALPPPAAAPYQAPVLPAQQQVLYQPGPTAQQQQPAYQPAPPTQQPAPVADWRGGQPVQRLGQLVVFGSLAGGVGKTVTTISVADHLARSLPGRRVAALDFNIEQGDFRIFLDQYVFSSLEELRVDPGLTSDPDAAVLRHMKVLDSGLHVLFAPPKGVGNPAVHTPAWLGMILGVLRRQFDYILVDTQSAEWHDELFSELLLPAADRLLVVVNPEVKSVRNNREWMDQLQVARHAGGANVAGSRLSVIVNKNNLPGCLNYDEVNDMLGHPHILGMIPDRPGKYEVVAARNRDLKDALTILCSRLTGDPALVPRTGAGRRLQWARFRRMVERGGGR